MTPNEQTPTYGSKTPEATKPATNTATDVSEEDSVKAAPKPSFTPSVAKESVTTPMRADSQTKKS